MRGRVRVAGETREFRFRSRDVLLASVSLVIASPLLLPILAIVALTPGSPVYRSRRIAQDGTEFDAFKIRTMYPDADLRLATYLAANPAETSRFAVGAKDKHDPRITRIGRVLRTTSLDELPQLVNVLRGEMSLVGPRPKLPAERAAYGPDLAKVLTVPPGLTGLWQTSGRSNLAFDERIALDVSYVENRSWRSDATIMRRTALQLLRPSRHGAV